MKINFVIPPIGESGGINIIQRYASELTKRGHDVQIYLPLTGVFPDRYATKVQNFVYSSYCFIKALIGWVGDRDNRGRRILRCNNYFIRKADVTIATAWPTAYLVAKLNKNKGEKYYFIQDFEVWDNKKRGLGSYRLPLKHIVISDWINQQVAMNLDLPPAQVVYDGLDIPSSQVVLNTKRDPFSVLMLNHTLEKKGVEFGLKAFRIAKKVIPELHLTMFGMSDSSNLPDDMDIEYHRNPSKLELSELYAKNSIFLFPSIEEGWGLTPLEAISFGEVVVGTSAGFAHDLGMSGYNMLISKPKDSQRMAEQLIEVVKNTKLKDEIQSHGRELAKALSWDRSTSRFEQILSDTLEKRER